MIVPSHWTSLLSYWNLFCIICSFHIKPFFLFHANNFLRMLSRFFPVVTWKHITSPILREASFYLTSLPLFLLQSTYFSSAMEALIAKHWETEIFTVFIEAMPRMFLFHRKMRGNFIWNSNLIHSANNESCFFLIAINNIGAQDWELHEWKWRVKRVSHFIG